MEVYKKMKMIEDEIGWWFGEIENEKDWKMNIDETIWKKKLKVILKELGKYRFCGVEWIWSWKMIVNKKNLLEDYKSGFKIDIAGVGFGKEE